MYVYLYISPSPTIKCCSTTGTYSWWLHQVLKWSWSCCLELLWRCHQGLRIQTQAHTDVQVWLEMLPSPPPPSWPGEAQAEPLMWCGVGITVHIPFVLLWRQSTVMSNPPSMTIVTSCSISGNRRDMDWDNVIGVCSYPDLNFKRGCIIIYIHTYTYIHVARYTYYIYTVNRGADMLNVEIVLAHTHGMYIASYTHT